MKKQQKQDGSNYLRLRLRRQLLDLTSLSSVFAPFLALPRRSRPPSPPRQSSSAHASRLPQGFAAFSVRRPAPPPDLLNAPAREPPRAVLRRPFIVPLRLPSTARQPSVVQAPPIVQTELEQHAREQTTAVSRRALGVRSSGITWQADPLPSLFGSPRLSLVGLLSSVLHRSAVPTAPDSGKLTLHHLCSACLSCTSSSGCRGPQASDRLHYCAAPLHPASAPSHRSAPPPDSLGPAAVFKRPSLVRPSAIPVSRIGRLFQEKPNLGATSTFTRVRTPQGTAGVNEDLLGELKERISSTTARPPRSFLLRLSARAFSSKNNNYSGVSLWTSFARSLRCAAPAYPSLVSRMTPTRPCLPTSRCARRPLASVPLPIALPSTLGPQLPPRSPVPAPPTSSLRAVDSTPRQTPPGPSDLTGGPVRKAEFVEVEPGR
ncbi:hypothetical protein K438DRAFT_1958873 [Mycena galopus ATCC 62051]|nr:hypothetical protein K438DRAFT_1958873 [Mycena galopus ATCC 62051]